MNNDDFRMYLADRTMDTAKQERLNLQPCILATRELMKELSVRVLLSAEQTQDQKKLLALGQFNTHIIEYSRLLASHRILQDIAIGDWDAADKEPDTGSSGVLTDLYTRAADDLVDANKSVRQSIYEFLNFLTRAKVPPVVHDTANYLLEHMPPSLHARTNAKFPPDQNPTLG